MTQSKSWKTTKFWQNRFYFGTHLPPPHLPLLWVPEGIVIFLMSIFMRNLRRWISMPMNWFFFLENVFFTTFLINSGNLKLPANVKNIAPIEKILSPMWSWEFQLFIGTGLSFWRFIKVLVWNFHNFGWFLQKTRNLWNTLKNNVKISIYFRQKSIFENFAQFFRMWSHIHFYEAVGDETSAKILPRVSAFHRRKNFWKRISIFEVPGWF